MNHKYTSNQRILKPPESHVPSKDKKHLKQEANNMEVTRSGCIMQTSVTTIVSLVGFRAPWVKDCMEEMFSWKSWRRQWRWGCVNGNTMFAQYSKISCRKTRIKEDRWAATWKGGAWPGLPPRPELQPRFLARSQVLHREGRNGNAVKCCCLETY